jgi:hypothetical protein
MADDPLDEKTALVTGASSGIGEATAHALARDGARVALAARREKTLSDVAKKIESEWSAETLVVPTNVRDESSVEELFETVVAEFGALDVLVNNAGLARGESVEEMTTEQYESMMETDVDGVFYATREAIPHLRETAGNLIFVGSFAGQYPRPFNPVYAVIRTEGSDWRTRAKLSLTRASGGSAGSPTASRPARGNAPRKASGERSDPRAASVRTTWRSPSSTPPRSGPSSGRPPASPSPSDSRKAR